jgi:hypothetical protein
LFAALVLVLALAGGASLRQAQAQNQSVSVGMMVFFGRYTQPIRPGVVCKDRAYVILADPTVDVEGVEMNDFNDNHARVHVTNATLGTIVPNPYHLTPAGGPARFTYRADRIGQETLRFTAEMPRLVTVQLGDRVTTIDRVNETFQFEVVECSYRVTFIWSFQFAQGGFRMVQFGYMPDTLLGKMEDGTFAGNAPFDFVQMFFTPARACVLSVSDAQTRPYIIGKLVNDARELELTIDYGTGTLHATADCPIVGSFQASDKLDLRGLPTTVTFPKEGGAKSFTPPNMPGPAQFRILVSEEVTR